MLTLGLILAAAGYIAGWPLLTIGGAILAIYGAVKDYGGGPPKPPDSNIPNGPLVLPGTWGS